MAPARYIAKLFCRWRSTSSTSPPEEAPDAPEAAHLATGREGERLAARHLRRQGYKVLYRNFRPPQGGEIDLVCREKKTLVFVEVKTRAPGAIGRPADAVDPEKEEALMRGAQAWLRLLGHPAIPVRIDIVEVILGGARPEITLTRDALAFTAERG
jgi:putative endonuclease